MIEHPVDKAYREMNEARSAVGCALEAGDMLEAYKLQDRADDMAVSFTTVLWGTLKDEGYDARAYAQDYRNNIYVKVGSHIIEVCDLPYYIVRLRSTDTMYGLLTSLSPRYGDGGIYPSSIVQVIDALREIDTTIRTYGQCTTCHYSSLAAMRHGNHYYCGAGAVATLPQCSQYRHYPIQSLLSWMG